ncbi:hypothetical protein LCGC14_1101090 [marine sediment metagenome]|uniref:Uncharacterized protein n=1 Tax=marine sediment metagenome TaxID=412755 RepID=A0A0F9MXA7_9ZZZZ
MKSSSEAMTLEKSWQVPKKKKLRISLKGVVKPKKKERRKWGELTRCYRCREPHPGWRRGQLRMRKGMPYCPEHLAEYDGKHAEWPSCPNCGSQTEFGTMEWKGSVKGTTASCDDCGFSTLALGYFEHYQVWVIAAPIVKR